MKKLDVEQRRAKWREKQRKWRERCRELGVCLSCGHPRDAAHRSYCAPCLTRSNKHHPNYRKRLRDEVFNRYGGYRCACCGETEPAFLTIDHANDDGAEHRKSVHPSRLYRWLRQHAFPPGFQVLCLNCNFAKGKRNGDGVCPHKKREQFFPEYVI